MGYKEIRWANLFRLTTRRTCYQLCLYSIAWACVAHGTFDACAQTGAAPTFERATQYAATFTGLNEKTESNYTELASLFKQIEPLSHSLQDTEADLRGIQGFAFEVKVQQMTAIFTADANNYEVNQILAEGATTERGVRRSRTPGFSHLAQVTTLAGQAKAEAYNLEQIRAQLSIAQRATLERRLKILNQLQDISRQAEEGVASQKQLIEESIEHIDLAGKRSRLELRAALHSLESADRDNAPAALARGITLLRLDRLQEAETTLSELVNLPDPISTVALAARAELYSRLKKNKDAKSDLGRTMNSPLPAVLLLRARAWSIMGMHTDAQKSWEQLSKTKYQHIAWSSLALVQCSGPTTPNPNLVRKALEQTQLADDLASGTDWYYKLAMAFAQAANKDLAQAADTAHQAANLTAGDKRQLCLDIAEQFKNGQSVKWKW